MNKKKITIIIIILITILLLITVGYCLFFNKNSKNELNFSSNSNTPTKEKETASVEPGELLTLESDKKSFYLPKGWTYKKDIDENYIEYYTLEGNDLTLKLKFLPVEDGSKWSKQDNIEYSTSTSRLYKEDGVYKAIFNLSQTRIYEDFVNNTKTEQDYGLFLVINKDNKPLETLTTEEYSYIKFILDSFNK
jgi:hypothetical protein